MWQPQRHPQALRHQRQRDLQYQHQRLRPWQPQLLSAARAGSGLQHTASTSKSTALPRAVPALPRDRDGKPAGRLSTNRSHWCPHLALTPALSRTRERGKLTAFALPTQSQGKTLSPDDVTEVLAPIDTQRG